MLSFYRCRRVYIIRAYTCAAAAAYTRTGPRGRVCVCVYHVCVYVLLSRFVNYIGPDQTSYTHTRSIRFLIPYCFFIFFFIVRFLGILFIRTYARIHTHSFALLRTSFVQTPTSIRISFRPPQPRTRYHVTLHTNII